MIKTVVQSLLVQQVVAFPLSFVDQIATVLFQVPLVPMVYASVMMDVRQMMTVKALKPVFQVLVSLYPRVFVSEMQIVH